jgi:hypothetical protein
MDMITEKEQILGICCRMKPCNTMQQWGGMRLLKNEKEEELFKPACDRLPFQGCRHRPDLTAL